MMFKDGDTIVFSKYLREKVLDIYRNTWLYLREKRGKKCLISVIRFYRFVGEKFSRNALLRKTNFNYEIFRLRKVLRLISPT